MMEVKWSKINQAYFIMWNDEVISIKPTKIEVIGWMTDHGYTTIDYTWKQ